MSRYSALQYVYIDKCVFGILRGESKKHSKRYWISKQIDRFHTQPLVYTHSKLVVINLADV